MSKKIEIPLEGKVIKSVPVKFPDKCVYCGALKQKTLPKKMKRKYSSDGEYEMEAIDIPYCEQHFNEIKAIDAKAEKFARYVEYPLMAISALVSELLFYKPLYNWLTSAPKATFVPQMPSVVTGFATLVLILFGPALILFMAIGAIGGKILEGIFKQPYGLKTSANVDLMFDFQNEQIAEEFLVINQEIGAREWSFKQSFKEGVAEFKKVNKESMEEARKSNRKDR